MGESGRVEWQHASDLGDLGRLTARWLEGDLTYHPGRTGPVRATARVTVLAALNRAGFFTTWSQIGAQVVDGCGLRPAVGGFCDRTVVAQIEQATLITPLIVVAFPPSVLSNGLQIPVRVEGGAAHAWIGTVTSRATIEEAYGGRVSQQALLALEEAWQVTVLDPRWDDHELLWTTLGGLRPQSPAQAPEFP